jgi:hypothetical protein
LIHKHAAAEPSSTTAAGNAPPAARVADKLSKPSRLPSRVAVRWSALVRRHALHHLLHAQTPPALQD